MTVIRFAITAVVVGSVFGTTRPMSSSSELAPDGPIARAIGRYPSIVYDQYLVAEIVDPAPAPLPDAEDLPEHGPSVGIVSGKAVIGHGSSTAVEWRFGCYFEIRDEDENYWNFTYEARLFDPDNNQIAYHTSWAYKPAFSSELAKNITDPAEGTYRCTIDWWVESSYVGQGQATTTISYQMPTGEVTESSGWWELNTTVHKWTQTLTGGNFGGRRVSEEDPGNGGPDTCWFQGSDYAKFEAISTPNYLWDVGSNNTWGPDHVGWSYNQVSYYRNQGREPCETSFPQDMVINRPGPGMVYLKYVTNTLRAGFTYTTVWSERAGEYVERIWP